MSNDPAAEASRFLLDLAHGKYDEQIAEANAMLTAIGRVTPWALVAKQGINILLMINKATAPLQVVADGRGGYAPVTNSTYDPKTGYFT